MVLSLSGGSWNTLIKFRKPACLWVTNLYYESWSGLSSSLAISVVNICIMLLLLLYFWIMFGKESYVFYFVMR